MRFIPYASAEAQCRFPQVTKDQIPVELIAVSDEGGIYRGDCAWIMCLYALQNFREWSIRLSSPLLRPLARKAIELISDSRFELSHLLHLYPDHELALRINKLKPFLKPPPLPS